MPAYNPTILPRQGEGDRRAQPGGGGGGLTNVCQSSPSTMLRMVPLPLAGEDQLKHTVFPVAETRQ